MALTENVGGSGVFKAAALGTSQSYVLSASTSPLVLTPSEGKVIRLDFLGFNDNSALIDTSIYAGNDLIIEGDLRSATIAAGSFSIGRGSYSNSSSNFAYPVAHKEPIAANEPNQSITIETTDSTAQTVYYSVSYGDLV